MTVAVPVERYPPFPWKPASHLPSLDEQPYSGYHGKTFVASDAHCATYDVATNSLCCYGSSEHHANKQEYDVNLAGCRDYTSQPTRTYFESAPKSNLSEGNATHYGGMGGGSTLDEGVHVVEGEFGRDDETPLCVGRKRKLCEMLEDDDDDDDCGCRTPHEVASVSETIPIGHSEVVVGCCHHDCESVQECCQYDADEFFPEVSSEIELPLCYEPTEFHSHSSVTMCPDPRTPDFMDNVIPDILPSCRTSDTKRDEVSCVEAMRACSRRRLLDVSLTKMRCIDDPEVSLRRSVLIANLVAKLQREIRQEDYEKTVLPKKRRSYRRPWQRHHSERLPEPLLVYHGNQPRRRLGEDITWDVYPTNDMLSNHHGGKCVNSEDTTERYSGEHHPKGDEDRNSLLGDIDSIFQSLMACVGGS